MILESEGGYDAYVARRPERIAARRREHPAHAWVDEAVARRAERIAAAHVRRQAEADADAMGAQTHRAGWSDYARQWRGVAEAARCAHDELIAQGFTWDGMDGYYR